ncbi:MULTISPECIES: YlbF family regulator [Enterococcus]|uniref:YlbF family regulator n=1 Tax=Enterococcus TaxID=1350 RepID=UPI0002EE242F|nr:YlbF family regulator [Enterococcus mundtii]MDB7102061.1 YlbF family regulator [Enterococcus mundtii]
MQDKTTIQLEVDQLATLLKKNETIKRYQELEHKVKHSRYLNQQTEALKQAQKDAVQYAHYGQKEAEKEAIKRIEVLTQSIDEYPLVIAYRRQLMEANELLQHLTQMIQNEINEYIEEEHNASKN